MKPKILLVDDREDNLLSIETILEPNGYKFVKATSGRQALKILLSEFDFAMILMDVEMPNLNGFETAALIYERDKLKHIPIIFITANNYGDENLFKGYQSGAIDYIFKPINSNVLRAKVGVLIDLYKKNRLLLEQEQKLIVINKNLEMEINDRKASEEKVKSLNYRLLENISNLESANKDLERFAFMASHDLQEPLRKIRMFSNRLYDKHAAVLQDDSKMVMRIEQAAERMQKLIVDILTFSKLSIQSAALSKTDINGLLNELMVDLVEEVKEKKASIIIDAIPALNVNPDLLRLLFQNLINNSLKYQKENVSPVIKIWSELSMAIGENDKNFVNKYCRIFIEDNGIGFDQKYAEDIFGMFKRLHDHEHFEGTGVGLALCKKITELHNGFISARSTINEGSTFIISLPVAE
jgi:signal transduction histidine kinase